MNISPHYAYYRSPHVIRKGKMPMITSGTASYGGCGHCGTPKCPSGQYGGCGTFFGKTKKPDNRACWLEKKIAKHQECCDRDCSWWSGKGNQANQCRKVADWTAELEMIHMEMFGPTDYSTATDMQAQMYQAQVNQEQADLELQQAQTTRMLIIAGGGAVLLLLGVLAVR